MAMRMKKNRYQSRRRKTDNQTLEKNLNLQATEDYVTLTHLIRLPYDDGGE